MKRLILFALVASVYSLNACTGIRLTAKDGSMVHGRTLEFGTELEPGIAVIPRGYTFTGTTPLGDGLSYCAKYGIVGSVLFGEPAVVDGMNEKGLSVGTFYFPGFAKYAESTEANQAQGLSPTEFPNWILTQFANISELKAALPHIALVGTKLKSWGNQAPPFHYIVYDKEGSCCVIEPIDGTLVVRDNPFGVFTNSPSFDWHLTNLRNYINLKVFNATPIVVAGVTLNPLGQGTGMVGLPGDFTPPSRFVRAFAFSSAALPSDTAEEAVLQVFHILNQFDIPKGFARGLENGVVHTDYTMMTCARDPQALKYYFKTYNDQTLRSVDLNSFNLKEKKIKMMSMGGKQTIEDVSVLLK